MTEPQNYWSSQGFNRSVCVCVCPVFYGRGVLNISVSPAECVSWQLRAWMIFLTQQNEVGLHSKDSLMTLYNKSPDLIRHTALIRGGNNIIHTEASFRHMSVWYHRSLSDSSTLMMPISMQLLISLSLLDVSSFLSKLEHGLTLVEKETGRKRSKRHKVLFWGMASVRWQIQDPKVWFQEDKIKHF